MKNTFGNSLSVTIFGESRGDAVGIVIDGMPAGYPLDEPAIKRALSLRNPVGDGYTARCESDDFSVISGVYGGFTCGTPICITIPNEKADKAPAAHTAVLRPSHADYSQICKYGEHADIRGGGHSSGRVTAALVAAGAVIKPFIEKHGVFAGTHVLSVGNVCDRRFTDPVSEIPIVSGNDFPLLNASVKEEMLQAIRSARAQGDSLGGMLETAVCGLDAGIGDPWFDTVEGKIAHIAFSVPGVKGIDFGEGFSLAGMRGSEANDLFCVSQGSVATETNRSGGINGGITNGMPIVFRTAFRPAPTIMKAQNTIGFPGMEPETFAGSERNDTCFVPRAAEVMNAAAIIALADMLAAEGKK